MGDEKASMNRQESFDALVKAKTLAEVKSAVAKGADVNAYDDAYSTPLHHAKSIEIAKFLIDHGADATAISRRG